MLCLTQFHDEQPPRCFYSTVLDPAPTEAALAAPLPAGLVAATRDEGCLSVLQFGPEARNAGMSGFPDWLIVWRYMFDERFALLVVVEVAVGEIDIHQPGAVVAAEARQPRLASAEVGVESDSGL